MLRAHSLQASASALVLALVVVALPAPARPIAPPPIDRLPSGARPLCSEHVTGTTMHITWDSFAVRETVAETRAYYERMGLRFTADDDGGVTHAPNAEDRLMIYPANGAYPRCAERPRSEERTVIVRSRATR